MGLVRAWTGQLARAAGASLLAPLVLLVAAGVVASAGGLGSFSSLGEAASGPSLPDIGLAATPGSALEGAEIVGADLSPPPEPASPALPAPEALASAAPPAADRSGSDVTVSPPEPAPPRRRGESFELREPTRPPTGGPPAPTAPPRAPTAPAVPPPVEELLEATRGLGDVLREPLEPLTDTLMELLGPPPRR